MVWDDLSEREKEDFTQKRTKALAESVYQTFDGVCYKVFGKHIKELNEEELWAFNQGVKNGTRNLHGF